MTLHIAFVMDGNRRWAVSQGKSKLEGHKHGSENLKKIIEWGKEKGLRMMTFYTFSTKNFQRSEPEKKVLFELFRNFFKEFKDDKEKKQAYTVRFLGRLHLFPKDIQEGCKKIEEESKGPLTLNFCFGYGGHEEIVDACNKAIEKGEKVDEATLSQNMYLQDNPEIVIRTGGAVRTSDFLPWQTAYSEWFFPETFWPGLTTEEIEGIITSFQERKRNFGK